MEPENTHVTISRKGLVIFVEGSWQNDALPLHEYLAHGNWQIGRIDESDVTNTQWNVVLERRGAVRLDAAPLAHPHRYEGPQGVYGGVGRAYNDSCEARR